MIKHRSKTVSIIVSVVAVCLFAAGVYLLLLVRSPISLSSTPDQVARAEQAYQQEQTDYIKVEKLNLLVPIVPGDDASALEKGAWHRFPERGDPEKGGNFILSAHRFQLGLTPQRTKARSPFYHLDKLQEGDTIKVNWKGQWYDYTVTKTYSVKPDAIEIEAPSTDAKMTLYSCSLGGQADGRIVIEATPQD